MRQIKFRGWHVDLKVMLYPPNPYDSMFDARPHTKIHVCRPILDMNLKAQGIVPKLGDETHSECKIPAMMTWDGRLYIEGNLQNIVFQQSTGLIDKNDKEIFEGDILQVKRRVAFTGVQKYKTVVNWDDLAVSYSGIPECFFGRYYSKRIKSAVVIGNIYENQELLK